NNTALGATGVAGTQEIALTNAVAGSTSFQLYFDPASGAPINGVNRTTPITFTGIPSADALAIQNALQGLTTVGVDNVLVIPKNPGIFLVTFYHGLTGTSTLVNASLSGGAVTGTA